MSKTIMEKIYSLFLNEMSLFEDSSYFSHQDSKSISDCGDLTEAGFRIFLRQVVGERFHITHGYIFSSSKKKLSKQIDIIITDKLVTHSLKKFEYLNGMEIVPVEAIVGIFEVKRTLTKSTYEKAIKDLNKIINDVPIKKDLTTRYFHGGMIVGDKLDGGKYSNPMVGILSLLHEDAILNVEIPDFLDVVFSCDGFLKGIVNAEAPSKLLALACRPRENKHSYSNFIITKTLSKEKILQGFVSLVLRYLDEVAGRPFEQNDYFS